VTLSIACKPSAALGISMGELRMAVMAANMGFGRPKGRDRGGRTRVREERGQLVRSGWDKYRTGAILVYQKITGKHFRC
jgi:hypothetical protein